MAQDVDHLLRYLRVPDFRYRDLHSRAASSTQVQRPKAREGLTILALVSLVDGVGRTTLAALLAERLGRRGVRSVALDLDPQGLLAGQFNGRPRLDLPSDEHSVVEWIAPGFGYVPYGHDPASVIDAGNCDLLILDTPAGASAQVEQVLVEADEVFIVARPDRLSLEAVQATEALLTRPRLRSWRRSRARYLINSFDGRRSMDREVLASLRRMLGARLISPSVQEDEAVREAVAAGRSLEEQSPQSQVLKDLDAIVELLVPGSTPGAERRARSRRAR